jgi:hypothetical protein
MGAQLLDRDRGGTVQSGLFDIRRVFLGPADEDAAVAVQPCAKQPRVSNRCHKSRNGGQRERELRGHQIDLAEPRMLA